VREVELAFLRGDRRDTGIQFRKWPINERDEAWQTAMRERLTQLVARERELQERKTYRPNPYANCRFCDFRTLCPLWAEGQPIFPVASLRRRPEGTPVEAGS
jgi:hypothetical protein